MQRAAHDERPADEDWRSGGWGFGSGPGSTFADQRDRGARSDAGTRGISPGPGGGHGEQWDNDLPSERRSRWWYQGESFATHLEDKPRPSPGRGLKNYQRDDRRVYEDVCDRLTEDPRIDAREIEVRVENGEVSLDGSVRTRFEKREAENVSERVRGVKDVHNRLRIGGGMRSESGFDVRSESDDLGTGPQGTTAGSRAP
jgi:hypothetical protein